MKIIPAIDLINGKCVRLSQGNYSTQKVYNENPVEVAKEFEDHGIQYLHLVDLDGAKKGEIVNNKVLEQIATQTNLIIDFGGGIKNIEAVQMAYDLGANQVTLGSIAIKNPDVVAFCLSKFGGEKLILGADVNKEMIAINGWQTVTETSIWDFLKNYSNLGLQHVICTDIQKDGLLEGSSIDLYQKILDQFPKIKLIASGGVTNISELYELEKVGLSGAIIGKAIYENRISLKQLSNFITK